MTTRTTKTVIPVLILVVGIVGAVLLGSSRKAPERKEMPFLGPLVEVMTAVESTVPQVVRGHGEVTPKITVEIVPQVSGVVVRLHEGLEPGGHFKAGEELLQIEPRDYELAVERAMAAVARTRVGLEREQAEAEVARKEWDALHPGEEPSSGLVVREPQVRQAEAELAAAEADLAVAELHLSRTAPTLPFDGVVESESIDLGQYLAAGRTVATVYGTREAEVRIPLAERDLAWFRVPSRPGIQGPAARVTANFGGVVQEWMGEVVRMEARVDSVSRMVPIVIAVPNPFKTNGNRLPLLPGTFVDVEIDGYELENVIAIPRYAVHEGQVVWRVEDERLRIVPVSVARTDLDTSYIDAGLEPGDTIIISQLDAITDGMKVRAAEDSDERSDA